MMTMTISEWDILARWLDGLNSSHLPSFALARSLTTMQSQSQQMEAKNINYLLSIINFPLLLLLAFGRFLSTWFANLSNFLSKFLSLSPSLSIYFHCQSQLFFFSPTRHKLLKFNSWDGWKNGWMDGWMVGKKKEQGLPCFIDQDGVVFAQSLLSLFRSWSSAAQLSSSELSNLKVLFTQTVLCPGWESWTIDQCLASLSIILIRM